MMKMPTSSKSKCILICAAGLVFASSATAGPTPPGGTSPVPSPTPSAPIQASPAKPELALLRVDRVDATPLTISSVLALNVVIENKSPVAAKVAAGVVTSDAAQQVIRSASANIAGSQRATLRVNVPITPRGVRREQFKAHVVIVDPTKPANANILEQAFRDGNAADNSKTMLYPVKVSHYDVSVLLKKVTVHEDCNPGPGKANWNIGFTIGSVAANSTGGPNDLMYNRPSFLPRPAVQTNWPGTDGDRPKWQLVSTGESYASHLQLVRLNAVTKGRHLGGFVSATHSSNFGGPTYVGGTLFTLPPDKWNFGGTFDFAGKAWSGSSQNPNCGKQPYTFTLQITTAPTTLI